MRSARPHVLSLAAALASAACVGDDTALVPGDGTFEGSLNWTFRAPSFVHAERRAARPAISGGTLTVLHDDRTAVVSDPDHDAVWLVDLRSDDAPRRVSLSPRDEPGRVVEDDRGGVHVVLRGGGAVATIDVARATVRARRSVCPAPRGLAWNPSVRALHVACAGGEFVTLPAAGEALPATVIAPDLRDVVVHDGAVYVSEFRRATLRRVDVSGGTARATVVEAAGDPATETTAWRLASVAGSLVTLSQSVRSFSLGATSSTAGYYGNVNTATIPMMPHVRGAIPGGELQFDALVADGGLTVDVAAVEEGGQWRVAVASPGWAFAQGFAQVREWTLSRSTGQRMLRGAADARALRMPGQAVAVAYTASRELIVQTRAPGRIVTPTRTITLYDDDVAEVGHDVFHATTNSGLACASCHPEGGDDGLTWRFAAGSRRTPSLRGGILRTAPFHWSGDLRDMGALSTTVFTSRMGGGRVTPALADAMGRWVDTLPATPKRAGDAAAVARGEAIFRSSEAACASCHRGEMFTDNNSVAVGTGGIFQVPPLVGLAGRAPYMHDGCAPTLRARFTDARCGGGDAHGHTAQLTEPQLGDLVAYLESL